MSLSAGAALAAAANTSVARKIGNLTVSPRER
jgi:hypothetical protein